MDDLALYLTDGDDLLQILRKGDLFDLGDGVLRAVSGIQSAALNNHNQLLFGLSFADNTSGVFLATTVPEPMPVTLIGVGATGADRQGGGLAGRYDFHVFTQHAWRSHARRRARSRDMPTHGDRCCVAVSPTTRNRSET